MHFIAGIVTFNPDIDRLSRCIESVHEECEHLIIIDNGSKNLEEIKKCLSLHTNANLIANGENYGIARALNQIFHRAVLEGVEWVLTLDQDTIIPKTLIPRYQVALNEGKSELAIICPQIHDDSTNITWPAFNKGEKERYIEKCITSASLNNVKMWEIVGGFDENLFIDEVDHDYCFRVRESGGKILLVNGAVINHNIGNSKAYSFLGKKIIVRNHSAFRKYYITRNILLVDRKQHGRITLSAFRHCLLFSIKTLLFEDDKGKKLLACIKGFADGVKGV